MFVGYLFLRFKDCRKFRQINPSHTLMNLQYQVNLYKVQLIDRDTLQLLLYRLKIHQLTVTSIMYT